MLDYYLIEIYSRKELWEAATGDQFVWILRVPVDSPGGLWAEHTEISRRKWTKYIHSFILLPSIVLSV